VVGQLPEHPVPYLLAVEQGEVVRPLQLGDVVVELLADLDQVSEIPIEQRDPPLDDPLRRLDVEAGDQLMSTTPSADQYAGARPAPSSPTIDRAPVGSGSPSA